MKRIEWVNMKRIEWDSSRYYRVLWSIEWRI